MKLCRPGIQSELDRFYKEISGNSSNFESLTKSAFTQSRAKLKPEAFIELADEQRSYFEKNAPYKKDWNGRRVVAIDGSTVALPWSEELKKHFDKLNNSSDYKTLLASISTAYDVSNQIILDAQIEPYETSEISLAENHLKKLKKGDIVIMDRGYPSLWLFGLLKKKEMDFCIRLSSTWADAKKLLKIKEESDLDWNPKNRKKELNPKFKEHQLEQHIQGLRLVSIDLGNGQMEVLATSLIDREKYPIRLLKELYHLRWKVEENYKFLKHVLEVEYFSAKSVMGIKQDFYARVFMANMASMISSQAIENKLERIGAKKYRYQLNRTQATAKIRDLVIDLFCKVGRYKFILQLKNLLMKCLEPIRPNRKFPRKPPSVIKKNMGYRGI